MWPTDSILSVIHSSTMIKGSALTILLLLLSIYHVDAFLPEPHPRAARALPRRNVVKSSDLSPLSQPPLTHAEILWKLRPPPGTSVSKKLLLRLGANAIRIESFLRGVDPPFVLCPKGGQAVLEAYYQGMLLLLICKVLCVFHGCSYTLQRA